MKEYTNVPQMPSFTCDDGILADWKPTLLQSKVPLGHAEVPVQQSNPKHMCWLSKAESWISRYSLQKFTSFNYVHTVYVQTWLITAIRTVTVIVVDVLEADCRWAIKTDKVPWERIQWCFYKQQIYKLLAAQAFTSDRQMWMEYASAWQCKCPYARLIEALTTIKKKM